MLGTFRRREGGGCGGGGQGGGEPSGEDLDSTLCDGGRLGGLWAEE